MTGRSFPAGLVTLLAIVAPLAGQDAAPPGRQQDVRDLDAIIAAYYEVVSGPAGAAPDRARDRWLHHPAARVAITGTRPDGTPFIRTMTLDEYHDRFGGPRAEPFYEREIHRTVQRFGNVAHVWSTYASSRAPGGTPFTRGINSIQLYHDGTRWWITGWIFDSERQGHPIPTVYLTDDPTPFPDLARARMLLLGTFHFDDPGLDDYKPQFPWDPHTPTHQREIEDVVERLAQYAPTRIALEWPATRQARLDSLYRAYREDDAPLAADERQQLGFRLARRLGHDRVYAVDAPARSYFPDMTQEEYEARVARLLDGADPALVARYEVLEGRYAALHRQDDSLKTLLPLRDLLLRANAPEELQASHGQYLIGEFQLGRDDDWFGPDMRTRWYNRNLRIFHNLQRITPSPQERVLLIIGAGHVPILRHAALASPEYELVDVADYLGR